MRGRGTLREPVAVAAGPGARPAPRAAAGVNRGGADGGPTPAGRNSRACGSRADRARLRAGGDERSAPGMRAGGGRAARQEERRPGASRERRSLGPSLTNPQSFTHPRRRGRPRPSAPGRHADRNAHTQTLETRSADKMRAARHAPALLGRGAGRAARQQPARPTNPALETTPGARAPQPTGRRGGAGRAPPPARSRSLSLSPSLVRRPPAPLTCCWRRPRCP
jgi:hypothetical protein